MCQNRKLTLVYIVGRGHSGSTLLDVLLGSHPAVTGLGELKWLSNKKKTKNKFRNEKCACGAASTATCPFWGAVDARLRESHHLGLENIDVRSNNPTTFARHNMALFESIRDTTGANILVDSSKSHERLQQLRTLEDKIDLLPVYVVRDPCGVIFSHIRRGRGLKHWGRKYRSMSSRIHASLRGRRFYLLEYEDLTSNPEKALASLASYIGLEQDASFLFGQQKDQHLLGGNMMKLSGSLEIVPDVEWKSALSILQKAKIRWYTRAHLHELKKLKKEAGSYLTSMR